MNTQQIFSSMHTHNLFCDGKNDIESMCRAAYEQNLYAIGFSSHSPNFRQTGFRTTWNMHEDNLEKYVSEVLEAKKNWHGKLNVFLGLETDYIKGMRSALDSDIKAIKPDYLIGSLHYLVPANGAEPFTADGPIEEVETGIKDGFGGDACAFMHCYYDSMLEMIETGGFDILGHADILKKNFEGKKPWPENEEALRQKEIAIAASKAGLTVEVNTGGINQGRISETYPSVSFLKLFCENKVPVIITADAHKTEHINGNYNKALQTLISADFCEHHIFTGRKNDKALWENVKILN